MLPHVVIRLPHLAPDFHKTIARGESRPFCDDPMCQDRVGSCRKSGPARALGAGRQKEKDRGRLRVRAPRRK